ncbi:MAG: ABC transporter permease subunit, partial [Verrucomicrobia bacterium]|nr:ABC transporter permease subunit [Verrucomicrobiota bacterium]
DDFEPKLGLVPLIFGSLKGTLYAMLISVPLALFGALYTSQFTTPRIRGVVKPAIEVMAAIPSVVVGFLAALWFAPLLESSLTTFVLSMGFVPVALVLAIFVWQWLRRYNPLRVVEAGYEFVVLIPIVMLAVWAAALAGPWLQEQLFDGNLQQWIYEHAGVRYDPRNCVVIAFALGFAVIPIIFTIAEDAFSNVPRNLTAASLAMGASRWQTVWRVVLPSASPGIFAGMIIGFGRAVGETMIVLMATGNTPIMDWSPFNGMRTLSANIAVEIPEAPFGGTLYRTLFLSAVILFLMTFVLNTVAEVVRQRLRQKYGQFQ